MNFLSKKNEYNLLKIIKENFDIDYDCIYHSYKTDVFYFENKKKETEGMKILKRFYKSSIYWNIGTRNIT